MKCEDGTPIWHATAFGALALLCGMTLLVALISEEMNSRAQGWGR